jgi:hypothetical protein
VRFDPPPLSAAKAWHSSDALVLLGAVGMGSVVVQPLSHKDPKIGLGGLVTKPMTPMTPMLHFMK